MECGSQLPVKRSTAAAGRSAGRKGPERPSGVRHSLTPSTLQRSSSSTLPASSGPTSPSGMKRALFQRTLVESGGGQTLRGGITKPISSTNGKQELKRTAEPAGLRAVASSQSSRWPSRRMAPVHGSVERIAVIGDVHGMAIAGIRTDTPRTRGTQLDDEARLLQRHQSFRNAAPDSLTSFCSAATSAPAISSFSAAPEA